MRVFDPSTRAPLRMFKGHTKAVRCVAFGCGKTTLLSGGDDGCVRLWDVAAEQCITTVQVCTSFALDRSACMPCKTADVTCCSGRPRRLCSLLRNQQRFARRLCHRRLRPPL